MLLHPASGKVCGAGCAPRSGIGMLFLRNLVEHTSKSPLKRGVTVSPTRGVTVSPTLGGTYSIRMKCGEIGHWIRIVSLYRHGSFRKKFDMSIRKTHTKTFGIRDSGFGIRGSGFSRTLVLSYIRSRRRDGAGKIAWFQK